MNKLLILLAIITISCGYTVNQPTGEASLEDEISEINAQKDILVGDFQVRDLQQKPFSSWFKPRYENYKPEAASMETIQANIRDYEIKVIMGTWCRDSKREIPKLLKILDNAQYDYDNLQLIGVDYDKKTPSGIEKELKVHRVPTIIFYQNGKEINRFVEYSREESIEEDIAKIVTKAKYKNSYAD